MVPVPFCGAGAASCAAGAGAAAGAAVILSSHLLHLVEEICTRVLVMQRGRAVAIGTIAEIKQARPELAGLSLEGLFIALVGTPEPA